MIPTDRAAIAELVNNYHTARAALDNPTRYERMIYAAKWYARAHPETTSTGAYKALERALAHREVDDVR